MSKKRQFWIFTGAVNIILSFIALYATIVQLHGWRISIFHSKWILLFFAYAACALLGIFLIIIASRKVEHPVISFLELDKVSGWLWKAVGLVIFIGSLFAYFPVRAVLFREFLPTLAPAVWVIWVSGLLGSAGLKVALRRSWPESLAVSLTSAGIAFQVLMLLRGVSNSPFSITWSEGSSLYYASLINARSIYGQTIPLSTLNPTYYFLRGIPFLIPALPIFYHRLWNLILWLGITLLTSVMFARRLNLSDRLLRWLASGWFFLFLLNGGPVHYELQVCVILVLWGVSLKHPLRSLVMVVIASIWAGMSRLNWFPVPAMLAIAIYLLERPVVSARNLRDYFKLPLLWAITGIGAAFVSQFIYIFWSGNSNNLQGFSTSLTSDLLWYRLLPNATYPLGVLAGILIFTFPAILVIFETLHRRFSDIHPLRLVGLMAMLLVLFIGGAVVSVKIGGGSDLHNLDSFRIMLALVSASLLFGRVVWEEKTFPPNTLSASWAWPLLSLLTLVVLSIQPLLTPVVVPDVTETRAELNTLQRIIQQASTENKSILFISQRQLLAFGSVDARIIPEYDVIELTEMAMAGNSEYLNKFHADIRQHHFDMIVADVSTLNRQGRNYPFGEENDLWIEAVYTSVYCGYQPDIILEQASIQVMSPRTVPSNCP